MITVKNGEYNIFVRASDEQPLVLSNQDIYKGFGPTCRKCRQASFQAAFRRPILVHLLDGISEIGAYVVLSGIGNMTCLRHLLRSSAAAYLNLFKKKEVFLSHAQHVLGNHVSTLGRARVADPGVVDPKSADLNQTFYINIYRPKIYQTSLHS